MKKILILSNSSSGAYDFRKELIIALINNNCSVIVANPEKDKAKELELIGCKTILIDMDRRGMNPIKDIVLLHRYIKLLKKESPDLVITYTIKPNIYGGLSCRIKRIPYAINITGLGSAFEKKGLKQLVVNMYKIASKKARIVFFENSANRDLFITEKIVIKEKTKVLNGAGVNLNYYNYIDYPEIIDGFKFLFVGRLMKEKGVDELFSAMRRLIDDGEKCSLMILGRCEESYEEQIKQYQKEGWLEYYGYQSDVRPYIAKAHCFVLPSYHEGMANTNLESAASGRPIITSNIPGCKEAVVDGVSGILCEPQNSESLYFAMKKMINVDDKKEMGKKGREHMENVFDKRRVVRETLEGLDIESGLADENKE